MHLNVKIFTGSERETVVVFEGVGGLEVKDSVQFVRQFSVPESFEI